VYPFHDLDYIEIPIMLRMDVAPKSRVFLHAYAGPAATFNVSYAFQEVREGVTTTRDCWDRREFGD
jgi:hypothetical protein